MMIRPMQRPLQETLDRRFYALFFAIIFAIFPFSNSSYVFVLGDVPHGSVPARGTVMSLPCWGSIEPTQWVRGTARLNA